MNNDIFDTLFKNYLDLIKRIDTHINQVTQDHKDQIACKKGCDDCCRFLSLFPVEAFILSKAFCSLPEKVREKVMVQAESAEDKCPLLVDHACMAYNARPVICRTHGYPLYMKKDGEAVVAFCPENFKGLTQLPQSAMLDLDQLNTLLTAVNAHFMENLDADLPARIPVSQALELWHALIQDLE